MKNKKVKRYSEQERKEILDSIKNTSLAETVKKYGVSYSAIDGWKKKQPKLAKEKNPEVNIDIIQVEIDILRDFIHELMSENITLRIELKKYMKR